jgi:flagellar biosynthetic protein FlhB
MIAPWMFKQIHFFTRYIITNIHEMDLSDAGILFLLRTLILAFLKIALPIMLVGVFLVFIGHYIQAGFFYTLHPLMPNFSKLIPRPDAILKRLWISKTTAWNLLKALVKVGFIGYLSYQVIRKNYGTLLLAMHMEVGPFLFFVCKLAFEIIIKAAIVLLIIALIDWRHQKHEYIESLKMTKQEVKDEHKMIEGDPLIKAAIRKRQREVAMRRMMQEVPKADVVITNPTKIAVAIKYDMAYMSAPVVVAKGEELIAQQIIEVARENGVPVIENKPLAWALYETTEVGEEIPPELYRAVAEVLSYVYQMKEKARAV